MYKEHGIDFECEIRFKLGKTMQRNHNLVFEENIRHVNNDITNPYKVRILQYAEPVYEIFELSQYLSPPINKSEKYHEADWAA